MFNEDSHHNNAPRTQAVLDDNIADNKNVNDNHFDEIGFYYGVSFVNSL